MIRKFKALLLRIVKAPKGEPHHEEEDMQGMQEQDDLAPTRPYAIARGAEGYLRVSDSQQTVLLQQGFLVGRGTSCHLTLADPNASRVHASFTRTADGWLVQDNSSKNGTLLNGKRIASALLQTGDQVQIGQTVLIYGER